MEVIHEEPHIDYTLEKVLEMLGGYDYFTPDQVHYVFLKLNGRLEEASMHYEECMKELHALQEKAGRMVEANQPNEHIEIKKDGSISHNIIDIEPAQQ